MGGYQPQVLAPIVFAAVGALFVLLGDVVLSRAEGNPRSNHSMLAGIAAASLALAGYAAFSALGTETPLAFDVRHPMLRLDAFSAYLSFVIALASLLCVGLSVVYLKALHIDLGEFYALLLLATSGMLALVSAVDLISIYVGLELMTLPTTLLCAFDRGRLRSNEAGLKYLVVGAVASAVLLYGMALLYGAAGTTNLDGIRGGFDAQDPIAMVGLVLVLFGLAFKVAAVPFHQWLPDVYEGAPVVVTAWMSVAVKAASFGVLLRFLLGAVPGSSALLGTALTVLAVATMIVGNLMAVIQTNLKRMMAWSSVGHAGFLLVGFAVGTPAAWAAVLLYLLLYLFTNLGVFGVLVSQAQGGRECESFEDVQGLARRRPALAAAMTLFVVSLAGIPGTAGFIAKFHLFLAAVDAERIGLVLVAVAMSAVSVFTYLRLPVAMYMRSEVDRDRPVALSTQLGLGEQLVLGLCAAAVLGLGVHPASEWAPVIEWARAAIGGLPY